MHGVFSPKSNTARLCTSKKEEGRGLHSIDDAVHHEKQSFKYYVSRKADSEPLMAECKHLERAR